MRKQQSFNFHSIKFHLILLVVLISLPFCFILISSLTEQRDTTLAKIQDETKSLVLSMASQQEGLSAATQQLCRALAQIQDVQERSRIPQLNRLLATLLKENAQYNNILIADPQGRVWAAGLPFKPPLSIAERKSFRDVLVTRRLATGEFVIGKTAKNPVVHFAYPVLGRRGELRSVIVIAIDLNYLKVIYRNYLLPDVQNAVILDHRGVIMYRAKEPERYVGRQSVPLVFASMRQGPVEGLFRQIGIDHVRKLFYYKRLYIGDEREPYMYIFATFSEQAALDATRQAMLRDLAKFLLVFSAALSCAVIMARFKITKRVELLLGAIREISDGEYRGRVATKVGGGELGILAEAFDEMNDRLSARDAEKQLAARELQESHRRLLTILNSMQAVIYVIDEEYRILFANQYVKELLGTVVGELCWRSLHAGQAGPCESCSAELRLDPEGAPPAINRCEFRCAANGRWYEAHERTVQWIDGRLVRLEIAIDISERKRMEEERLNLKTQLLHSQKLESLGVLAGGIAHDFNNILTAILGNTELALMRLEPDSPVIANLNNVNKAARRATDLAQQMLAYSGKGRFVIETINPNALIEEMRRMLEVSISKKATISFHPATPMPNVEVDATQIRQVIMNLVINASEAIGEEPGSIAVSTGSLYCDRGYLKKGWINEGMAEGNYVCIEVADTGCGMDRATLARLFEPFFTTKFTGRGLGMAAVQGIIAGHRGGIKVESEPGKGTSFTVLLPASGKQPELPIPAESEAPFRGEGTVLLVDDEQTVLDTGGEMLGELGFRVVTVNDARQTVPTFARLSRLYCVILDLTMPHLDGEQLCRELRSIDPQVRVVLSSGYSESEVTRKFCDHTPAGFIQKPYDIPTLRRVLASLSPAKP